MRRTVALGCWEARMRAALRYRRAQALAVAVLAALVTMCLVLAPLYTLSLIHI